MGTPLWNVAAVEGSTVLTDSVARAYAGNGCFTWIELQQPIDLTAQRHCRVFFRMGLSLLGSDHFIVQSNSSGGAWQDERFYTPVDNTAALRAESVLLAKSAGAAVSLTFLIHGFGASTSDGVYLDDFDVRCDSVAPVNPTLSSPSHALGAASSNPNVVVNLAGANDSSALASGVAGYSYALDASPATEPDLTPDSPASLTTLTLPVAPGAYYFHLRTVDGAGNWSAPAHLGPLVVKPVPAIAVASAKLSGSWVGSKFPGTIRLALTATEAMRVTVRLKGPGLGKTHTYRCAKRADCAGQGLYAIRAGAGSLRLRLPAGVHPGAFTISVTAANVAATASKAFRIAAPRTGVLDSIYFSGRPAGSPASRIPSRPRRAFLVYRFASLPRVGPVHIEFRFDGGSKPFEIPLGPLAAGRRDNRLITDVPALHGRWTAIMSVRGKVIGRATVVFP